MKKLDLIFNSKASLNEKKTIAIIREFILNVDNKWIHYAGLWDNNLLNLAETFINKHATGPGILGPLRTSQPIHIGRIKNDKVFGRIDLLIYQNGMVLVQTKINSLEKEIHVWVDRETAHLFRYKDTYVVKRNSNDDEL